MARLIGEAKRRRLLQDKFSTCPNRIESCPTAFTPIAADSAAPSPKGVHTLSRRSRY